MTISALFAHFPWDLWDVGVEQELEFLQGEVGAAGVSVYLASPPVTQFRARTVEPKLFHTRGGLLYAPDDSPFAKTRCKPIVSEWVKGKPVLQRIAQACSDRKMSFRATVSASRMGRFAQRYPEMATKNVFDDPSRHSLCLFNPDVQAFLAALAADISNHDGVGSLVLTDFLPIWWEAFGTDVLLPDQADITFRDLLSICFCESCRQQADSTGIDVELVVRGAQSLLQTAMDRGKPIGRGIDSILADHEPLRSWFEWRATALSDLLVRLTNACRCDLMLERRMDCVHAIGQRELDVSLPAALVSRLTSLDQLGPSFCAVARRNELKLPSALAMEDRGPDLVRALAQAVELGFQGVEFEDYGLLSPSARTPVRQAIRMARRTPR